MNKKIIGLIAILAVAVVGVWFLYSRWSVPAEKNVQKKQTGVLIGFSMGTLQEERWQRDKQEFTKMAEQLGAVVDVQDSNNDKAKQISQIESMILEGVDVLVIAPYDAAGLEEVIGKAHQAEIKVISYDRLIKNAGVDLYLSFDNEKVGEYQADYVMRALQDRVNQGKKLKIAYVGGAPTDNNAYLLKNGSFRILQPKIDSGEIEVVFDKFTTDWNPETAYQNLKGYLDETDGDLDGVVAANDGTAFGSVTALAEYSLDGKVPVSGQDAELSALRRIVQGTQTMTVYKPISRLASKGAELAIKLAQGENVFPTGTVNDGQADVSAVLLESVPVTKENIETTVVADGYYKSEDIYKK